MDSVKDNRVLITDEELAIHDNFGKTLGLAICRQLLELMGFNKPISSLKKVNSQMGWKIEGTSRSAVEMNLQRGLR